MFSLEFRVKQIKRFYASAVAGLLYLPFAAFAQTPAPGPTTPNALEDGLKALVKMLTGTTAKALAILAVVAFGIGALSGRVDWVKAVTVILAIGVVFSAQTMLTLLFGITL